MAAQRAPMSNVQMINLFGNNEESRARREALSFRDARAGDRKVTEKSAFKNTSVFAIGSFLYHFVDNYQLYPQFRNIVH